jgi:signal transduction histidine kinase
MVFSFYYIYQALIHHTLFRPYDSLFRDLKKSEEKLIVERNELITLNKEIEAIVETVPDAILLLDTEGRVYLTNYQFQQLYKQTYHEDFSIGNKLLELPGNYLMNNIKEFFNSRIQTPKIIQSEIGNYYQISSSIIHLSSEAFFGVLIVIHDVTEFIEIENLRKQILSNVSHELRTPLTIINMSIKNLENYAQRMSDDQKEAIIKMISKNSTLLSEMIEDLLTSSSIEAKTIHLQWAQYDLLALFRELLTQLEPSRLEKKINIVLEIDQVIQLFGDSKRISQVFRILVDNAIKYSHENSIITIKASDHYKGAFNPNLIDGVLVQVIDSGVGIKEKDLPNMFKRFFRSEDVINIGGTGLGLSIAQDIVQLHKGNIHVESEYGKGSTFSVFLPRIEKLDRS